MKDDMQGRVEIINNVNEKETKREPLKNGQIVHCKGSSGTSSFYGIVYQEGIIELPYGSDAYIHTKERLHLGDTISYWTIDRAYNKAKLIIEE